MACKVCFGPTRTEGPFQLPHLDQRAVRRSRPQRVPEWCRMRPISGSRRLLRFCDNSALAPYGPLPPLRVVSRLKLGPMAPLAPMDSLGDRAGPCGSGPPIEFGRVPGIGHMPQTGPIWLAVHGWATSLLGPLRTLGPLGRDQADYTLHQMPTFRRILHLLVLRLLSCCICLWQRLRKILYWLLRQRRWVPIRFFLDCRG